MREIHIGPTSLDIHVTNQPIDLMDPLGLRKTVNLVLSDGYYSMTQARQTLDSRGGDMTRTYIPGLGKAGIVSSEVAAAVIFSDVNIYVRDPSVTGLIRTFLGGPGPLTENKPHPGSKAVLDALGPARLGESGFMEAVRNRHEAFVGELLVNINNEPYEDISSRHRVAFLADIFFDNAVTPEEMQQIFNYPDMIFGSLLGFTVKGVKTVEKLPQSFQEQKIKSDSILNTLIEKKLESPSQDMEKYDVVDFLLHQIPPPAETDFTNSVDFMTAYSGWLGQIRSTIYQVTFAAKETTEAAIGFGWNELTNPKNHKNLEKLTKHAKSYLARNGKSSPLQYKDLRSNDPDILPFLEFFGHILVDFPPTYIDMRKTVHNVPVAQNGILPEGVSLIFDMERCVGDQVQHGHDFENPNDLANLLTFGAGDHRCVGAWTAITEGVVHFMTALSKTESVQKKAGTTPTLVRKSTQHLTGLYLEMTQTQAIP